MEVAVTPVLVMHLLDHAQQTVEHAQRERSHELRLLLTQVFHASVDDLFQRHACHTQLKNNNKPM